MNRELANAFLQLRVSERAAVMQDINVCLNQSVGETSTEYTMRLLRFVSTKGKIRELEAAMLRFQ